MCGITGFWTPSITDRNRLIANASAMSQQIEHRGPDDAGAFADAPHGVAFGFRRLAIVDLSEQGHQPMTSASGRYTIAFNGEVYNHNDLRAELVQRGCGFRGHSDTEVMLAAFEEWGVERALSRFNGMFAFALWDAADHALTLARDRMGKKPLFFQAKSGSLIFGSELKALAAHELFDRSLDMRAITAYLRHMYVPAPLSIFAAVRKLDAGHYITFRADDLAHATPRAYWSIPRIPEAGDGNSASNGRADGAILEQFHTLLQDAVRIRMQADVPLGALLSGGIDSSTVVAVMQQMADRPVQTFTIGFDVAEYNEAQHARAVAEHLGTDHTELYLDGRAALDVVPALPRMFDEPLADPSQIPTYLICGLARRSVTVALTGDGGDELFAGYHRYLDGERLINAAQRMPRLLRHTVAAAIHAVPAAAWGTVEARSGGRAPRLLGEKMRKTAALLRASGAPAMYGSLHSVWQHPTTLLAARVGNGNASEVSELERNPDLLRAMMRLDQRMYLPDDLLAKLDRASMAVSLEARAPLLDSRIVEMSWTLPRRFLIRDGVGKWILREILYQYVPRALVERPKMGFSVPIAAWLAGPLRSLASDHFARESVQRFGILDASALQREWNRFTAGDHANALGLWTVLMLQMWCEEWRPTLAR